MIWDTESFTQINTLVGHEEACSTVAWSADDLWLATASNDRTVRLWEPTSSEPGIVLAKHTESVTSVAWVNTHHLVSASFDKHVYLWSTETQTVIADWTIDTRILDIAISYDATRFLVNSNKLQIIDLQTNKQTTLPETDSVTSICASASRNEILASISASKPVIHLWDLNGSIKQRYEGHCQGRFVVRCCFGGPDETFVVSGSEDSQVYIWHRHSGSLVQVLAGHASTVNCVCWPSDFPLLSCGDDYTIRIWRRDHVTQETPQV